MCGIEICYKVCIGDAVKHGSDVKCLVRSDSNRSLLDNGSNVIVIPQLLIRLLLKNKSSCRKGWR